MDYFSLSQFYDRTCNNELLKMQTRFAGAQPSSSANQLLYFIGSERLIRSFCREMVGIEYVVALAQEPKLFLIHKRHRHGYDDVELLASYYVLDGSIYMCPDLYSVLSMRLASSAHFINKALEMGSQQLRYEPNEKAYKVRKASIGASSAQNLSETDISPSKYRLQDQVSLAFEANICL